MELELIAGKHVQSVSWYQRVKGGHCLWHRLWITL